MLIYPINQYYVWFYALLFIIKHFNSYAKTYIIVSKQQSIDYQIMRHQ